ncbi:Leucine-rich repeat domain protein, variant 2 [Balamuthia mandrillaris]
MGTFAARCKELKQAILAKHKDDEENDSQRSRSDQCCSMEKTAQGKGQEGRPRQQVSSLFSLCVNFLLAHIESCLSLRELEVPFLLDTMFWQLLYGSRLHLESLALLLHAGLSSAAFRDETRTLDLTDEWLPMLRHGWALAELDLSGQRNITDNGMLSLLGTEPICLHCGMPNPLYVVEGLTTSTTQGVLSDEIPQQALVCGKKCEQSLLRRRIALGRPLEELLNQQPHEKVLKMLEPPSHFGERLVSLSLHHCTGLTDKSFLLLSRLTSLTELDVSRTRMTAAAFPALLRLGQLRHLSLAMVDSGIVEELPRLSEELTSLNTLNVSFMFFGSPAGEAALRSFAKLSCLQTLLMIDTELPEQHVKLLHDLKGLTQLDLRENYYLTEHAIEALCKELPVLRDFQWRFSHKHAM